MKRLNLFLLCMLAITFSFGQTTLLNETDNVIEVTSRGVSAKKKEVPTSAVKQALSDLLINGIDGYNDGQPLTSPSDRNYDRGILDNMINNRHVLYMKSVTEMGTPKKVGGAFQGEVRIALYLGMIKKELKDKGLNFAGNTEIKKDAVAKLMPSVSIVPFKQDGENYKDLWSKPEVRAAITAVTKTFIDRGVETRNVLASAKASSVLSTYEIGSATSTDRELLMSSGTDVYVTVAYNSTTENGKLSVGLTLNAYETSTGIDLGAIQGFSPGFNTTQVDRLCARVAEAHVPDLLDQMIPKWNNLAEAGRSILISFSLDQLSATNFDSEVGADFFPLRDAIRMWLKDNAKDGMFKLKGNNDTSIIYDKVMIPALDDSGNPYSIDDFGFELYRFLRKDLGLACTRKIDSQSLMIVIK